MKNFLVIIALLVITSCSVPNRFIVSELGYEPAEVTESMIYTLPQTSLKVQLNYKKDVFIPGPYADYAMKLLGVSDVQKSRKVEYFIVSASVSDVIEPDADHYYSISGVEGNIDMSRIRWAAENNLIITDNFDANTKVEMPMISENGDKLFYKDVTMESNTELKKHTIYKTILTDTSFLKVPVTSEQMERKTREKKAEEAAKLILEIRLDRYYIAAGLLDPFPVNFDMESALKSLDKLESEYLSLFIGKSYSEDFTKEYFITPSGSLDEEVYLLDGFSNDIGIDARGAAEIKLLVKPDGNSKSLRNLMPQQPESESYNRIYYRIAELCEVKVMQVEEVLCMKRLNIFQSGALVNVKVKE
jgi:hypothetical protein